MLAVNGHAKHRQSLCRVGYGKTALSLDLFLITTANILSTNTFLLLSHIYTQGEQEIPARLACKTEPLKAPLVLELLQSTVVCGINHRLAGIEINLHTAILGTTGRSTVVGNRFL